MNTRVFSALVAASILSLGASAAHADCKSDFVASEVTDSHGGMRWEASNVITGVAPVQAYRRVFQAMQDPPGWLQINPASSSDSLTILATETLPDKKLTVGRAVYQMLTDAKDPVYSGQVTVTLRPSHSGTKATISVYFPMNMRVLPDAYCRVIEVASN